MMFKEIKVNTEKSECLINITEQLREVVAESKVKDGLCVVFVPHTTAAITINSCLDSMTLEDITAEMHRLIPTRVDFHHNYDTPADAAGHIKSVVVGNSLSLIIKDGNLLLGSSQSVLFFEFDGPRKRKVCLQIMADNN